MTASGPGPLHEASGPVALGTFEYGTGAVPPAQAALLLRTYHEHGGRLLDTAPTYGPADGEGRAESLIGRWLRDSGAQGMEVITKAGLDPARPERGDLRPETILASLARSTQRLGVTVTLVLHRDDPAVPVDEIADALDRAVGSGLARRVGTSNWTTARLARWIADAARTGRTAPSVTAPLWSIAPRAVPAQEPWLVEADGAHLRLAARHGLTVTPYRTLAAGFLADRHSGRHAAHHAAAYDTPAGRLRRARLRQAAATLGMTSHGLALACLRAASPTAVPVVGPRTPGQLRECLRGAVAGPRVRPELLRYLEARP
ncbi:aldo/keto reductase [Amycolatopsis sp. NPDC004079]|uniref:aldo/keto reductase n=1 Tax=Amycolatopsis sp. NPDC004079 TaxID=3154549 RepID=UPI0033AF1C07